MSAWVSVCEATSTRCGSRSSDCARRPTLPPKVALYITVWRLGGRALADELDVVDEAHVEHAVGLVQHQHLDVRQDGLAGAHVVHQAAGRGDQDVERAAQLAQLQAVGHAAHHGGHAQAAHVAAVGHRGFRDLDREFARRHQHQHARAVDLALPAAAHLARRRRGAREHAGQRRQHEAGGLAAAGAGRDRQVAAFERRRDRTLLDCGGHGVAGVAHGGDQGFVQVQGFETHRTLSQAGARNGAPGGPKAGRWGQVTGRSARVEHRARLPVRRYGHSQGDGIAADRTVCGATGLRGHVAEVRGDERKRLDLCPAEPRSIAASAVDGPPSERLEGRLSTEASGNSRCQPLQRASGRRRLAA